MAVGDFTIDSTTLRSAGNHWRVSGTVEVSTTGAQADIFPNGYIVSLSIDGNQDGLATAVPLVLINSSDDSSTADNGSIWIDGNAGGPDTMSWTADYIT